MEAIVRELKQKEQKRREKTFSMLSFTAQHLSMAQAYSDVIDMLEKKILTEGKRS